MATFNAEQLRRLSKAIFVAAGTPPPTAEQVSTSLVENNLVGHDSHGVIRVTSYVDYIKIGRVKPAAVPSVVKETSNTATVSGNSGFGQTVARYAMDLAIEKARTERLSAVGIVQGEHIGRLGEYSFMAATQGMIGMVFVGLGGGSAMATAPFGGMGRGLGTNPMSFAVPATVVPAVLVDFASSAVAEGKLRVARSKHAEVPAGWILDKDGHPSTDPNDFYNGGVLLPFGAQKGYALGVLMDLFGGALTGALAFDSTDRGNGTLMMVINPEAFRPLDEFKASVDKEIRRLKAIPPAPGFNEVLVPGEPEFRTKEQRMREGIYLPDDVWQALSSLAVELHVPADDIPEPAH